MEVLVGADRDLVEPLAQDPFDPEPDFQFATRHEVLLTASQSGQMLAHESNGWHLAAERSVAELPGRVPHPSVTIGRGRRHPPWGQIQKSRLAP